jgi:heptosyltransferase I
VDRVIPFQRVRGPRPGAVLRSAAALARTVREIGRVAAAESSGTFDLLLDLQVYFKAGLITLLAPARIKLGFDYPRTRDLNWLLTTHRIPPHPQRYAHVQDQYFEFLHHLGVNPEPLEYGLTLRSEERESQLRFLEKLDGPLCALVLATSKPEKDWNAEGFAEVARELRGRFGMHPVLVGGRSAREEALALEVARLAPGIVEDAREDDLRKLLWLLEGAELVISPDTGPLHMARALEVPVVGLFGATNPKRSGPYGKGTGLVVDGYSRFPGEEYGAEPELRRNGMARITPEMVLEKVALARG